MSDMPENQMKTNGRWTKVEHQKFLLGLQLYGKNWKKIEELIGTRTGSQIRSHAQKFFLRTKKDNDQLQNSSGAHEGSESNNPATVISKIDSNLEELQSEHSYFLHKIIRASSEQEELNFWDRFIDMGNSKPDSESNKILRRKDSFVVFDSCNDSKQETALSYPPILNDPL